MSTSIAGVCEYASQHSLCCCDRCFLFFCQTVRTRASPTPASRAPRVALIGVQPRRPLCGRLCPSATERVLGASDTMPRATVAVCPCSPIIISRERVWPMEPALSRADFLATQECPPMLHTPVRLAQEPSQLAHQQEQRPAQQDRCACKTGTTLSMATAT